MSLDKISIMKISYNWLKNFVDIDKSPEELSLILTDLGLEVESLEVVQSIPGGLEGLTVGEVISCEQHPNADKLKLTQVNVGQAEPLQIVCGAPNVRTGLKVIVAQVGTFCHPIGGEPFKITKSKIRGEVSFGMLCGADEVGLGTSHDGIVELEMEAAVGTPVKDYYQLEDDYRYEIGLTPNRADAASHLGVARDLAAYFRSSVNEVENDGFIQGVDDQIKVEVQNPLDAPRYSGLVIQDIQVSESPEWLRNRLSTIGIKPINNIVDVTNYILHDLGQPLHAFDLHKVEGARVVVRKAKDNENFVTLDGVERKLSTEDLVIADVDKPMCLAGVFGGQYSGVNEQTTSIFLESAYFNAVTVRKTAKRHGLKTDSSFRFERGTNPDMTVEALKKAAQLIVEIAGGKVVSTIIDQYPSPIKPFEFEVRYHYVQRVIGQEIPTETIKDIIKSLGIRIEKETSVGLQVLVPPYKVDVTREIDVVEEVLRIYGYNNIELKTQIKASLNTSEKPDRELLLNQLSDFLIANGFREILNNSLTKTDYLEDPTTAVSLLNPLSSDLDVMRQNLLFSTLISIGYNQKRKHQDLKIFEYGRGYQSIDGKFFERQQFALAVSGNKAIEQWNQRGEQVNFYDIKAPVDAIVKRLKIQGIQVEEYQGGMFSYGLTYRKGEKVLVSFGAVSAENLGKTDVDGPVFFAQFDWDLILRIIRKNKVSYKEVSKYPPVRRDLALLVDEGITFEQLRHIAQRTERKLLKDVQIFDVYKGDKLPAGKKSYALSFTLQDEEKTLTDKQIDGIIKKLILNFEKEVGASVR